MFALAVWLILLFVFTCTESTKELYYNHSVGFQWESSPVLADMLENSLQAEPFFIMQKVGHVSMFVVLFLLLHSTFRSRSAAFWLSLLCAGGSEVLQLYFGRDGRIHDIFIDSIGIGIGWLLVKWRASRRKKTGRTKRKHRVPAGS